MITLIDEMPEECYECQGSGMCTDCQGMIDDDQYTCTSCWGEGGDGECPVCGGTGEGN